MKLVLKGFLIGLGKIMPGISGAMIAISLNEYNKIIESIANIKKNTYNKLKYLSNIGIGIMLAIIFMSKIIVNCLNHHYLSTILLFIGIISSGTLKTINATKWNKKDIIVAICTIIIGTIIIKTIKIQDHHIPTSETLEFIKLIGIGVIDSGASIIPGISGTALLMYFGCYDKILNTFATISKLIMLKDNLQILFPFIIGFIVGTILISRIINKLLKICPNIINIIVIIFMIHAIIILGGTALKSATNSKEIILGIILFNTSLIISLKISNKKQNNQIHLNEVITNE